MSVRFNKKRQCITLKKSDWDYLDARVAEEKKRNRWTTVSKSILIERLIENDKEIRKAFK